jgi:hypothetical protein
MPGWVSGAVIGAGRGCKVVDHRHNFGSDGQAWLFPLRGAALAFLRIQLDDASEGLGDAYCRYERVERRLAEPTVANAA